MPSGFSKRHGYDPPKKITFREELPVRLRGPILKIVGRYVSDATISEAIKRVLDPYEMDDPRQSALAGLTVQSVDHAIAVADAGIGPVSESKARLLTLPWFQVYDVIEEIVRQLEFYEAELRTDPEEELRVGPLQVASLGLARPKSMIRATPSLATMMLLGLMSR